MVSAMATGVIASAAANARNAKVVLFIFPPEYRPAGIRAARALCLPNAGQRAGSVASIFCSAKSRKTLNPIAAIGTGESLTLQLAHWPKTKETGTTETACLREDA
jgi:flavoprotein